MIDKDLSDLPIFSSRDGATVYLRDVAQVRDGYPPQQNIVHVDGQRSVVLQVLKNGATLHAGDRQRHQGEGSTTCGRRCRRTSTSPC